MIIYHVYSIPSKKVSVIMDYLNELNSLFCYKYLI